jgi:hypothetical protein
MLHKCAKGSEKMLHKMNRKIAPPATIASKATTLPTID